jgi:hypothetical protein
MSSAVLVIRFGKYFHRLLPRFFLLALSHFRFNPSRFSISSPQLYPTYVPLLHRCKVNTCRVQIVSGFIEVVCFPILNLAFRFYFKRCFHYTLPHSFLCINSSRFNKITICNCSANAVTMKLPSCYFQAFEKKKILFSPNLQLFCSRKYT